MILIDGKKVASDLKKELKTKLEPHLAAGKTCGLAVIIAGDDPASKVYVRNKINSCEEVGIKSFHYELPSDVSEKEITDIIEALNDNDEVFGILVQLPLPKHLDERKILSKIDPLKDVDGFSPFQTGRLVLGEKCFPSCTPGGVMELLKYYSVPVAGKNAVVIGRSNTVGKPMALMLLKENATVTICHSKTVNISEIASKADILVVAIGKPRFVTKDMVKDGAVVIDVGINRVDGKLCGDVDFDNVKDKCSYITPVPGGVGPMTVAMLMKNTVDAFLGND